MRLLKRSIILIIASVFIFSQVVFGGDADLSLLTKLSIKDDCHASTAGEVINGMWQEKQDVKQRNMTEKKRGSFNGYVDLEPNEEGKGQDNLDLVQISLFIEDMFVAIAELNRNYNETDDDSDIIATSYDDQGRLISYIKITKDQARTIMNITYDQQDRVVSYAENSKLEKQNYIIERQAEVSSIDYNSSSSDFSQADLNLSLEITNKNDNSKEKISISGKMRYDNKGEYYLAHGTSVRFYFWSKDNLSANIKQEYVTKDETSLKALQELHSAFVGLIVITNKAKEDFVSQLDLFYEEVNAFETIESQEKEGNDIIKNTIDISMEADASLPGSNNKSNNSYVEKADNRGYQVSQKTDKVKEVKCSIPKILMELKRTYDKQLKSVNSDFLSRISEVRSFIKEPILAVSAEGIKALVYIPPKLKK